MNKKGPTKFDIDWDSNYALLKKFKKRFGHCSVPQLWPDNISLGRWVIRQRAYKNNLSDDRLKKLGKINFIWNSHDAAWENKFSELIKYKKIYGHTDVSKSEPGKIGLAHWVVKQRKDKKKNEGRLTSDKIKKLEAIGFNWNIYTRYGWDTQYQQLLKFKEKFGHCDVPRRFTDNVALANWVAIQRRDKAKLTPRQILCLNDIGFKWRIKIMLKSKSAQNHPPFITGDRKHVSP